MASIDTSDFGRLDYVEDDVFVFPAGLPGFEARQRFLLLTPPMVDPFCFLQSLDDGRLRFICLPVARVSTGYEISVNAEEAGMLEIAPARYDSASPEVAILTILTVPGEGMPTANMLAPVVLALKQHRGVQCIRPESGFSVEHPLQVCPETPAADPPAQPREVN